MLFLCSLGLGAFAIATFISSFKSFGGDMKLSFGGGSKTSTLTDGRGGKAQALKDKPRASNPLEAVGGALGLAAAVGTGGAALALKGAAGLASKGAKLGFYGAKMAGGALATGANAINKATGLTRKISGFVKPIGKKIRFKATSATGFLRNQLEMEGARLGNRFKENKRIIASNLPTGVKRGIKSINNTVKKGAIYTRDRTRHHLKNMKDNTRDWIKDEQERAARLRKRRDAISRALYKNELFRSGAEGLRRELGITKLPKNQRWYRTVSEDGVKKGIKDKSELGHKYMSYQNAMKFLDSKYVRATFNEEQIQKMKDNMSALKDTNERVTFSKEVFDKVEATRRGLTSSYGQRFTEAFEKANIEAEKQASVIMGNELGKNKNFHTLVENHLKNTLGGATKKEIQEGRTELLGNIAQSIMSGASVNGQDARDYLSDKEIAKLQEKIQEAQDHSLRSNVMNTRDTLTIEYRNEHPETTIQDASARIRQETDGIVASLNRLQQSTPRTEVVTNNTQTQVVSNNTQTQVVQTSGNSEGNTVAQTTSNSGNTVVNNTTVNNTSNNTQTTTQAVSSQQSTSNINGGNARTVEKVTERVVEKGPSINTAQLTEDIRRGITEDIRRGVTSDLQTFRSGIEAEIDRMKSTSNLSSEEVNRLKTELSGITAKQSNQSMEEVLNKFTDEFYMSFGPTVADGKRRVKEIFKTGGNIDQMSNKVGEILEEEPIRSYNIAEERKRRRGRKPKNTTYDDAA